MCFQVELKSVMTKNNKEDKKDPESTWLYYSEVNKKKRLWFIEWLLKD